MYINAASIAFVSVNISGACKKRCFQLGLVLVQVYHCRTSKSSTNSLN